MQGPFPDEVEVPYGLVNFRLTWGVPTAIFGVLLLIALVPLYLGGRSKWWVALLAFGVGWLCAEPAKEDPQFVEAWSGEMSLKDYYE